MSSPYTLHREQWVPRPLDDVFAFFSDARNLEILTPDWLKFKIVTPEPIAVSRGAHIQYRLSWHHIPLLWTTEFTRWNPPHDFEDIQLSGPYKLWRHTHTFEARDGGTQISDNVEYTLPFGPLGKLAHAFQVRRNIEKIFDYRYQRIQKMFS
ncbi:MAG: SRPBCC family protein [Bryobacterales bacterium]|nr:SRPBCC family protein [Bryobacterales bacterium]